MLRIDKKDMRPSPKRPQPGQYRAVVTAVKSPEGFEEGNAIDVYYMLTDPKTSKSTPYQERFFIVAPLSERTMNFEKHLDEIGAERYEDYIGCELELVLAIQVRHNKPYPNIVQRTIISYPPTHQEVIEDA